MNRCRTPCSHELRMGLSSTHCCRTEGPNMTEGNMDSQDTGFRTASSDMGRQIAHSPSIVVGLHSRIRMTDCHTQLCRNCCRSLYEPDCHEMLHATTIDAPSYAVRDLAQCCEPDHAIAVDQSRGAPDHRGKPVRARMWIPRCCWKSHCCDPPAPLSGLLISQSQP